jgi:tRNA (guanine-N7-)-methyltransferase
VFLDIYKSLLTPDGVLLIKTDNDSLYEYSLESLAEYGANIIYQTTDLYSSPKIKDNVPTGYEIK